MPIWHMSQTCIAIIGHSGIGKTAMMLQAPEIIFKATGKKVGLVIFNAATYTPMHMLGFGVVKHTEETDTSGAVHDYSEMRFSLPFFWRTVDNLRITDFPDGVVIYVDEIDKADPDVAKMLGELAYSHTVGTHRLPPGSCVWMSGNPADARYGSKKQLDYLINRQCILPVRADPEGWNDYGIGAGLTSATLAFAHNNQSTVFADRLPEKQGPWCTARSLTQWDRHLQAAMAVQKTREPPVDDDCLVEECEGYIGASAKAYFTQLKQALGMPRLADILADPDHCPLPSPDCMALLCYNTAFAIDVKNLGRLLVYVDRMPREFGTTFMRAAVQRNPKLILSKELGAWAQKNAQLLLLLNTYAGRQ
jgi:hypothetical protein